MRHSKEIYKLQLNERLREEHHEITRVPGGWLYVVFDEVYHVKSNTYNRIKLNPVFIPFDKEFE